MATNDGSRNEKVTIQWMDAGFVGNSFRLFVVRLGAKQKHEMKNQLRTIIKTAIKSIVGVVLPENEILIQLLQ